MTDRKTASTITDTELDKLYQRLDAHDIALREALDCITLGNGQPQNPNDMDRWRAALGGAAPTTAARATPPTIAHTHTWDGTHTLPAWIHPGTHHWDGGQLVIHHADGDTRPKPGWLLIGWTDGMVTVASPQVAERVYGAGGLRGRVERAEAELAALRAVARGYCPACGRGDAAPTVQDWEQQKQRADQTEEILRIAHDTSNKAEVERSRLEIANRALNTAATEAMERAETAEAAIARVRALHSNQNGICGWCKGPDDRNTSWDMEYWPCATIRATLDDPDFPAPEFGGSNGSWHWRCNGGQGCAGWVGVDLHSEDAAHREYARHFQQEHLAQPASAAATQATDRMQTVQGRCPACHWQTLFLGDGGHVTCSRIDCPNPSAADELLHGDNFNAEWQQQDDGTWALPIRDGSGVLKVPARTTMGERARLAAAWTAMSGGRAPASGTAATQATHNQEQP